MDLTETITITKAYRNLWDAIQDVDTPKEEHLNIKTKMMRLHAQIPSEEFETLADELPGYRAFQVRLKDLRASKFPQESYDTGTFELGGEIIVTTTMSDSEFLKWKRAHFRHLDDIEGEG